MRARSSLTDDFNGSKQMGRPEVLVKCSIEGTMPPVSFQGDLHLRECEADVHHKGGLARQVSADIAALRDAVAAGPVQGRHDRLYLLRRELVLRVSALLHQALTVGIRVQPLHVRLKQQSLRQTSCMCQSAIKGYVKPFLRAPLIQLHDTC